MDIYQRLKQDHDRLRELIRAVKEAPGGDGRTARFQDLQRELWTHSKIEETVFYEPLRQSGKTRKDVLEGLTEHHLIDGLLQELNGMPTEGTAWSAKFQVLGELLEHHLEEEEEEIFEDARKVLSDEQASRLGADMDARKRKAMEAVAPLGRM